MAVVEAAKYCQLPDVCQLLPVAPDFDLAVLPLPTVSSILKAMDGEVVDAMAKVAEYFGPLDVGLPLIVEERPDLPLRVVVLKEPIWLAVEEVATRVVLLA